MAIQLKATDLTRGEKLAVTRRREGLSQGDAANHYNVSPDTYHKWENDINSTAPSVEVVELSTHEVCYLLRRRSKLTQKQIAALMGTSRVTVNRMENGEVSAAPLAVFWEV